MTLRILSLTELLVLLVAAPAPAQYARLLVPLDSLFTRFLELAPSRYQQQIAGARQRLAQLQ